MDGAKDNQGAQSSQAQAPQPVIALTIKYDGGNFLITGPVHDKTVCMRLLLEAVNYIALSEPKPPLVEKAKPGFFQGIKNRFGRR